MTGEWPCSECPKHFTRKGDLTRHTLLHAGYKPHVCSECGKRFAQRSGLKTHMNVHTRVKPFRCDTCPAAFGDPSSRARHCKETHIQGPAGIYQCPESRCKSKIKRRSAFTAHLRKHGVKYVGVDIADFYSAVAQSQQATTRRIVVPKTEHISDFTFADNATYEPQPYDLYTPHRMLGYPHDYSNDMDLHLITEELIAFNSRSSSLSPPALTPSSSCPSISPSPSPLGFPDDEPEFSLPYVNIAEVNAFDDSGMPGACPLLSPVSQLMFRFGYAPSEYNKQPTEWV